jgi:hypothetical protein
MAPSNFGSLSGDLLIGNLYDSNINAYDPGSKTLVGTITVNTGFSSPVGLWGLTFGNGVTGYSNVLYFTAGINDQRDGLFGAIVNATPSPARASCWPSASWAREPSASRIAGRRVVPESGVVFDPSRATHRDRQASGHPPGRRDGSRCAQGH